MRKTLIATAAAATMALSTVAASSAPATASPSTSASTSVSASAPSTVVAGPKGQWRVQAKQTAFLDDRLPVGTLRVRRLQGSNTAQFTLKTSRGVNIPRRIIPGVYRTELWRPIQQRNISDPKHADYSGHWIIFGKNGCIYDQGVLKHSDYYTERRIRDGMDKEESIRVNANATWYMFASQRWSVDGRPPIRTNNPRTAATKTWDDFVMINHPYGTRVPTPRQCNGSW